MPTVQMPGLYFPFVHIRDDEWLKSAALYWPSLRRLVPRGYRKRHDSPTAKTFAGAGILRDEDPVGLLHEVTWDLASALAQNEVRLAQEFSLDSAYATARANGPWAEAGAPDWQIPALGWVHATKFPPDVLARLSAIGVARIGRCDREDVSGQRPEDWIGLHPDLAGAYMTALAGRLSEEARFEPVTDQADLKVATPTSDVGAALQLLLGRGGEAAGRPTGVGVETYVMLALQHARPAKLGSIPAEKIVKCREDLEEELDNFRRFVASQQAELTELAAIPISARRLEAFTDHVERTVEVPLKRLENGMRLMKLEPTRSLMVSSFTPPAAVSTGLSAAGAPPLTVAASGVVTAIGSAWWQVGSIRTAAKVSSPVGFLLDVRDELTPRTLSARARKVLRGTYGRGTYGN
ncbi:DUF6236 family protein [Nocardioides mesophilus]|uniref:Uncharacterized protein n=1 Tax=Nocardioides mesophilus TaxID=433659 RepID=A0A7G9RD86_9ACTN|nr:DUF6236 family protein [Nocardioides mesophilus]QNN53561.1 hypothetical protein H9L09_03800 [Nocardioides mesophilus]